MTELGNKAPGTSFSEGLERVFARSEDHGSVLDRPLGPTAACYSIRHMVNLFRWGASKDDVDHLSGCKPCQLWAENYAQSDSARAAQRKEVARSWRDHVAAWFRKSTQPVLVAPMLYVKDELVSVAQAAISMELALVAGVSRPDRLDVSSLKLEGDLFSNRATLMKQQIAGSEYLVVRFEDVQLADSLRQDVQNHVAVIQNVCLTGRFSGDPRLTLRGQANVHVGRAAAASMLASRSHKT